MRRSVVSNTSKPDSSAAFRSAPLLSLFYPLACAVCTVCSDSAWIRPLGVPWSKRTSTGGDRLRSEALRDELEQGLLHDLAPACAMFGSPQSRYVASRFESSSISGGRLTPSLDRHFLDFAAVDIGLALP